MVLWHLPIRRTRGSIGAKWTALICVFILAGAGGGAVVIHMNEPEAQRSGGAMRKTGMLVETVEVARGDFRPSLIGFGRTRAAREVILRPQVSGRLLEMSERFAPGGIVTEGEVLVKIDPADYLNTVAQRRSELIQARSALDLEMGRQDVAQREFQLLDRTVSEGDQSLVLRKPQLRTAQAAVDSAQAALDQAQLDHRRTTIRAPFDAQILSRNVSQGSLVQPSMELCRMIGAEEYWVIAAIPIGKIDWLDFSENPGGGSTATLRNRAWAEGLYRRGNVSRLIGELEEQTRHARVLITVKDPLAREPETDGPAMIVGAILEVQIEGRQIQNVFRLDRDYVRERDTVWVMRDGKLAILEVEIALMDRNYAYISEGLEEGDLIVMTNLTTVAEGAALRLAGDDWARGAEAEASAEGGGMDETAESGQAGRSGE